MVEVVVALEEEAAGLVAVAGGEGASVAKYM